MHALDILRDGFGRVAEELPTSIEGLSARQLLWQPAPEANHIAWLAWHIGRCEDAQMAPIGKHPQVYSQSGWEERFALPYEPGAMGYGQTAEQVRAFCLDDPALLSDYYDAVHQATLQILDGLSDDDLDAVLDDPFKVTAEVRLVSVVNDITQHLGQIGYLRGLLENKS